MTSAGWIGLLQDSDALLLERWCLLVDALHRELDEPESKTASIGRLSAEIRALETSIGANPRSRAALAWNGAGTGQPRRRLASVSNVSTGYTLSPAEMAEFRRSMEEADDVAN